MTRKKARTPAEALAAGMALAQEVGECLEWQGLMSNKNTQPSIKVRLPGKDYSDNLSAPRLLWEAAHGPIPEGRLVYRTCCNNACVCLDHLAIGGHKDRLRARRKAGKGSHSPATLIALTLAARKRANVVNTVERARMVRELLAGGAKLREVSEQTGVSVAMVSDIGRGRSWVEMGGFFSGLGARA